MDPQSQSSGASSIVLPPPQVSFSVPDPNQFWRSIQQSGIDMNRLTRIELFYGEDDQRVVVTRPADFEDVVPALVQPPAVSSRVEIPPIVPAVVPAAVHPDRILGVPWAVIQSYRVRKNIPDDYQLLHGIIDQEDLEAEYQWTEDGLPFGSIHKGNQRLLIDLSERARGGGISASSISNDIKVSRFANWVQSESTRFEEKGCKKLISEFILYLNLKKIQYEIRGNGHPTLIAIKVQMDVSTPLPPNLSTNIRFVNRNYTIEEKVNWLNLRASNFFSGPGSYSCGKGCIMCNRMANVRGVTLNGETFTSTLRCNCHAPFSRPTSNPQFIGKVIYLMFSNDLRLGYVGSTQNLSQRITQHHAGELGTTEFFCFCRNGCRGTPCRGPDSLRVMVLEFVPYHGDGSDIEEWTRDHVLPVEHRRIHFFRSYERSNQFIGLNTLN